MAEPKKAWKPLRTQHDPDDKSLWETQVNVAGTRRLSREAVANREGQLWDTLKQAGVPQSIGYEDDSPSPDALMYFEQLGRGMNAPLRAGAGRLMDATGLSGDHPMGDTITRQEQAFQSEMASQMHPKGFIGKVSGGAMGAAQQLPAMIGVGATAGLPGLVGMYSAQSFNDAYVQAIDAGLTHNEALKTATHSAVIEAGLTLGFSAVGMGGVEKMATQSAKKRMSERILKQFGPNVSHELVEEISIEMANALREATSGVDYQATDPDRLWDRAVDTAIQTVILTGGLAGIQGTMERGNRRYNQKLMEGYSAINEEAGRMLNNGADEETVAAFMKESKEELQQVVSGEKTLEEAESDDEIDRELKKELRKTFTEKEPQDTSVDEEKVVKDDGEGVLPVEQEDAVLEVDAGPDAVVDEDAPGLPPGEALPETDDDIEAEMAQEPEEEISDAVAPETPAEEQTVKPVYSKESSLHASMYRVENLQNDVDASGKVLDTKVEFNDEQKRDAYAFFRELSEDARDFLERDSSPERKKKLDSIVRQEILGKYPQIDQQTLGVLAEALIEDGAFDRFSTVLDTRESELESDPPAEEQTVEPTAEEQAVEPTDDVVEQDEVEAGLIGDNDRGQQVYETPSGLRYYIDDSNPDDPYRIYEPSVDNRGVTPEDRDNRPQSFMVVIDEDEESQEPEGEGSGDILKATQDYARELVERMKAESAEGDTKPGNEGATEINDLEEDDGDITESEILRAVERAKKFMEADPEGGDNPYARYEYKDGVIFAPLMDADDGHMKRWAERRKLGPLLSISPMNEEDLGKKHPFFLTAELSEDHPRRKKYEHRMKLKGLLPTKLKPMVTFAKRLGQGKFLEQYGGNAEAIEEATGLDMKEFWRQVRQGPREQSIGKKTPDKTREWLEDAKEIGVNADGERIYENENGVRAVMGEDGMLRSERTKNSKKGFVPLSKNKRTPDFHPVRTIIRRGVGQVEVNTLNEQEAMAAVGMSKSELTKAFSGKDEIPLPSSKSGRGVLGKDGEGYYARTRGEDEPSIAIEKGGGPRDNGWVNVPPVKDAIEVIESGGASREANKAAIEAADLQIGQRVMVTSNDGTKQIGATVHRVPEKGSDSAFVVLDNHDNEMKHVKGRLIQPDFDKALAERNERIEQGEAAKAGPNSDELGLDKGFAYPVGQFRRGERPKTLARTSVSRSVPKINGDTNRKAKSSISRLTQWLNNEAIEEAKAKNDGDAIRRFQDMDVSTDKKAWELPPADRDDMVDYVFGDGSMFDDPKPASAPNVAEDATDVADSQEQEKPESEETKEASPVEVDNRSLGDISLDDLIAASNEIAGVQSDDPRPEQKSEVKQSTDNHTDSKAKKNLKDKRKALAEEIGDDVAALHDKIKSLKKKFDGRVNANPMFDADILKEATLILAQAVKIGVKKFRHFLIIAADATDVDSTVRMGPLYEIVWNGLRERFPNIDLEEATDTQEILIEEGIIDEPVVVVEELVQKEKDFVGMWSRAARLFEDPGKGEKVITERRIESAGGYMSQSSADALIDQWTQHSLKQADFKAPIIIHGNKFKSVNNSRWVISLFDYSGVWLRPWYEAGYSVLQVDIQHGIDVLEMATDPITWFDENIGEVDWHGIHMVLAACPCTEFASSGARHWKDKPPELLEDAQDLANATMDLIEFLDPHYYAIENPAGSINKNTTVPDPRMSFHPNHFGNPYTKLTQLYGNFNPNLPLAPVYPLKGSETHSQYGGSSLETKNKRSETPDGFAAAFFMANNYLDMSDRERLLVDFEQEGLVSKALDAGVTPERIRELAGVGSHETAITDELLGDFESNLLAEANELRKGGEVLKLTSPAPLARTIEQIEALPKYTVYRQSAAKFLVRGDGKRGGGDSIHDTYAEAEQAAKDQKSRDDERFLEQGTSQELRDRAEEEIRKDYGNFLEFNPGRRLRAIAELERVKVISKDFTGRVKDFVRTVVTEGDEAGIARAREVSELVSDYVDHLQYVEDHIASGDFSKPSDRREVPAKWIGQARKALKGKFKERYTKTTGKEDTRQLTEGVLGKKDYSDLKALLTDLVGAEYVTTHRGSLRSKKDVIKTLVGIQDNYDGLLMEMSGGKEVKRLDFDSLEWLDPRLRLPAKTQVPAVPVQARDAAMEFLLQQKQAIRWPDGYGGVSYISPYGYLERILTHKFPSISRNNLDNITKEIQEAVDPDGSLAPITAFTNAVIYLDPHYFIKGDGKSVKLLGQYEREQVFLDQSFKSIYDSLTDEGEARISGKVLEDAKDAHAQRYAERLVEEAKRKESAEREEVKDYYGFLPDNPMQAGRIKKSLELQRDFGGEPFSSWKEYVEDRVKQGWVVGEDDSPASTTGGTITASDPILMFTNEDGTVDMSPLSIPKTAVNYAQFLIDEGFASKTGIVPINNEAIQASRQKKGLAKKKVRQAPVTLDPEKIFDAAFAVWEQLHPDATSEEKSEMLDALEFFVDEIWSDYGYSLTGQEPFEDGVISYPGFSKIEWDEITDEVLNDTIISFLNESNSSFRQSTVNDDYSGIINSLDQDAFNSLFAAMADAIERQMYKEASKPKKKKTLKEKAADAASVAEEKAEELRRKIRNLHSKPTMGVDLDLVRVAVDVAVAKIKAGVLSYAAFIQDFAANSHEGEMEIFGPYLDAAWETLGAMSDDDRKVLGVEKADTTKEATWREALNSTHAEPAKEGKAGKPEPVEKTADENADAIENDPSGRIMPGFRMFISGMSRGPGDIRDSQPSRPGKGDGKGRPVGVAYESWHKDSGKFLKPNDTVKDLLVEHVNRFGLPIFIDSGMFGVVSRGEVGQEADYEGALAFYDEMIRQINPDLRNLVYVVAPDFLLQTGKGKKGIRGDHDKTVALQLQHKEKIEDLAGMGANVIIPVQRSYDPDESLVNNALEAKENFKTWGPNLIFGIPYNAAAWPKEQIVGFTDFYQQNFVVDQQTGGPLRLWLLGGGPSKLKPLYETLKEISPTVELYGDASTEVGFNRGSHDEYGVRKPKRQIKLDDGLSIQDALEAFLTEGHSPGYEPLFDAIDAHHDTWSRSSDGEAELKRLIDDAVRVIASKIMENFSPDLTGNSKIDSDVFWNRIEDLFNRQPNKSFTDGKPDVFTGMPRLSQLLFHKYLQTPQAREESQDEQARTDDRGRSADQEGRREPDSEQDSADGTDGEVLAGEQQGDAQRTEPEGSPVGVRETPTGTTRQGSSETDADGESGTERGGTDSERLVGDGSRTARGRDGVGESTRPNYHLIRDKWGAITGGGLKARFARNQRAIELAIELTESGVPPTTEQQDELAAYTGWGAFGQALFDGEWGTPKPQDGWEEEDDWLREHLGKDAWLQMQKSIVNAHYTSPQLVSAIWGAVRRLGFNGGRVLEPSVGSGNFFGVMPRDLMGASHLTGVEQDETTAKIASLLYPQANIRHKGYEDVETADEFYDLVISNVPFGQEKPAQVRYKQDHLVHNFFFRRALDHVKPGGLVVFITGKGTSDGKTLAKYLRQQVSEEASVLGAVRLPSGFFQEYSKTNVVTDLIVIRKNRKDGKNANAGITWWSEEGEGNVVPYKTPSGETVTLNKHFIDNPQDVLGTINYGSGTTSKHPGLIIEPYSEEQTESLLTQWIQRLPENSFNTDRDDWQGVERPAEGGRRQRTILADNKSTGQWRVYKKKGKKSVLDGEGRPVYETIEFDGPQVSVVDGESIVPLQAKMIKMGVTGWAKANVKNPSTLKKKADAILALAEVRDAYETLLYVQRTSKSKKEIKKARAKLNEKYDDFVKKHGEIAESEALQVFKRAQDPMYASLSVLARKNHKTGEYEKATVFRENTVVAEIAEIKNASLGDAFAAERNRSRIIDYKRIAKSANLKTKEAIDQLVDAGYIYKTETGTYEPADIYLSGNVRKKQRALEAAIDEGMSGLEKTLEAIKKIVPEMIPYQHIETHMGARFIPASVYADFLAEKLNISPSRVGVRLHQGKWAVSLTPEINRSDEALQWGLSDAVIRNGERVPKYPFSSLVRQALNNGSIKIMFPRDPETGIQEVDETATRSANEALMILKDDFENWIWSDPARAAEVQSIYNEEYNSFVTPDFKDVPLSFVGIVTERNGIPFSLRKHQRRAVWRAIIGGKGIFAHEVGTGKTLTMGALAMESRRFGYAKKPMLLAHNANAAAVAKEIQEAYPSARILFVDNVSAEGKEQALAMMAAEDWDLVVVPHSLTSRFLLTEETITNLIRHDLDSLAAAAQEAYDDDQSAFKGSFPADLDNVTEAQLQRLGSRTAKELVLERNKLVNEIKKAAKLSRDNTLFFEDMGVDMIMVDEVHEYKKIPLATSQSIKGLNTKGSKRGIVLKLLTDHVRKTNNGRGIYTFSGTPMTNTLNEIYNQMRFVMAEEMEAAKIREWDAWFNVFAKSSIEPEFTSGGTMAPMDRLREFQNLPELRQMVGQYLDIVFASDMEEFVPRKEREGRVPDGEEPKGVPFNQTINVTSFPNKFQKAYSEALVYRYLHFSESSGREKRELAKMTGTPYSPLVIETEGVKMSLDPRLTDLAFNPEFTFDDIPDIDPLDPELKVNKMIAEAMPLYRENAKSTQMVFMETGHGSEPERSTGEKDSKGNVITEKVAAFNLAEEIKRRLMDEGVPENEIALFSGMSAAKRTIAAEKMRRGEIRFAIGSTQTMGVGVNAQDEMIAIHHLDCPWMPGWLEQRNGRGRRQGNRYNTIKQFRYVCENDQDARRWQIALTKDTFIRRFMKGEFVGRSMDMSDVEVGDASDFQKTLSVAAGDPRILLRSKLEGEVARLTSNAASFAANVQAQVNNAERKTRSIAFKEQQNGAFSAMHRTASEAKPESREDDVATLVFPDGTEKESKGYGSGMDANVLAITRDLTDLSREYRRTAFRSSEAGLKAVGKWRGLTIFYKVPLGGIMPDSAELFIGMDSAEPNEMLCRPIRPSLPSMESQVRQIPSVIQKNKASIGLDRAAIDRSKDAMKVAYPKQDKLDAAMRSLDEVRKEIRDNPDISPPWFRMGAPVGTEVFYEGKEYTVQNHRMIDTVIAVDEHEKTVTLPAKDLLDAADGYVYPELQPGYDGPIDVEVKVLKQLTRKSYRSGEAITVDLGAYSDSYSEADLAAIGVNPSSIMTHKVEGIVARVVHEGEEGFEVKFNDRTSKTLTPDGVAVYGNTITLSIRPQQDNSYGAQSINPTENPVLRTMLDLYDTGTSAAVPLAASPRRSSPQKPPTQVTRARDLPASTPFDERLEHLIATATEATAQEWDSVNPIDQHNWIDDQLGGQLYEYIKPAAPGEPASAEPISRPQDEVSDVIERVEDRMGSLLGRGRSRDSESSRMGFVKRPVKSRGRGGSKRREVDVRRNKTIGLEAGAKNPLSAHEIIKRVALIFDLPIRRGQIRTGVMGLYRFLSHLNAGAYAPQVARLARADGNNLAVLIHEVAHHVDEITKTSASGFPKSIESRLLDFDYDQSRTDGPRVEEGWAEFIRGWGTLSRKQRKKISGFNEVQQWFETTWANAHPSEYAKLKEVRAMIKRYSDQSVFKRLQSSIRRASDDTLMARTARVARDLASKTGREYQYDRLLRNKGLRAYMAAKDRYYALKEMEKYVKRFRHEENRRLRREGKPELPNYYSHAESAYEYATATHNTAVTNAEHAMTHGVFLVSPQPGAARPVIKDTSIDEAMSEIRNEADLEAAEVYMVAHHIVNMDQKKQDEGVHDYVWPIEVSEAKRLVREVEADSDKFQRYEKLRQAANRFNNGLLAMLHDAGAISQLDYERMLKAYSVDEKSLDGSLYVPMMRVTEKVKTRLGGSGHLDLGKAVKRRGRKGSDLQVISPMQSLQDRAITFYRVAQSVQLQKLLYAESQQAPGMAKFVERIDPSLAARNIPIRDILKSLVEEGIVDEDFATQIEIADVLRSEMKIHGLKKYKGAIGQDAEEELMDLAGYKPGTYKNKHVKKVVEGLPSAMSVITLWRADYDTPTRFNKNIKHFVHDGEDILVEISDELVEALSGNLDLMSNPVVRASGSASRLFKYGAVGANTKFGMRQISMDYMTNLFQAREQGVERYWMPLVYAAQFALSNIRNAGAHDTNQVRQLFRSYAGQKMNVLTPDVQGKSRMLKGMTKRGRTMGLQSVGRTPGKIKKFFEQLIAVSDIGPRYAEFVASLRNDGYTINGTTGRIEKNGKPTHPSRHHIMRAINAASDVTYNYRRTGRWGQVVEQFVPFTNAKLEGQDKRLRTLKNVADVGSSILRGRWIELEDADIRGAVYTTGNSLLALGVGALYYMLKSDDEEYEEEEFWQRGRGFSLGADGGVQKVFIPNSREFSILFGLGEVSAMLYDQTTTGENKDIISGQEKRLNPDAKGSIARIAETELRQSLGNYETAFLLDSGYLSTTLGAWANWKMFQGRSIEPSWMDEQAIPDEKRYTPYTSSVGKWTGKYTGRYLGKGPMYVDYVLGDLGGGGYTRATRAIDEYIEGDVTASSVPFAGGIYTNRHQKRSVNDLYATSRSLLDAKQNHEYGIPGSEWTVEHERFFRDVNNAKALASVITRLAKDSKSDVRTEVSQLTTGLAREALGRDPHKSNPSPWALRKSEFPKILVQSSLGRKSFYQELKDEVKGMIEDTTPSKTTKDMYASGRTREDEEAARKEKAEYAKQWLKDHADSPIVKEVRAELRAKPTPKKKRKKSGFAIP